MADRQSSPSPESVELTSILGIAYAHLIAYNKGKTKAAEEFFPVAHGYPKSWALSDIPVQPPGVNCTYLACPDLKLCTDCGEKPFHEDTLIVTTSAAVSYSDNQNGTARYGIAIYVGKDSEHNLKARLPDTFQGQAMTSQRVELLAAAKALLHIFWVAQMAGPGTDERSVVVIKTDLRYLVTCITERLDDWKKNGYNKDESVPAVNVELIKIVGTAVRMVERQMRCKVMFWHVKREENAEAVTLAREGSNEELRDWS